MSKWVDGLLTLIFPGECLSCGELTPGEAFCPVCNSFLRSRVETGPLPTCKVCDGRCTTPGPCGQCLLEPPPYERAFGLFDYAGPIGDAVRAAKYGGRVEATRAVVNAVREAVPRGLIESKPDLVVPIPPHRRRRRVYEMDLPQAIGRTLSDVLRTRFEGRGLSRKRDIRPQVGLDAAARRSNIRGAFEGTQRVVGRDVLVVDDVRTTGATLSEATCALRAAGALRVRVLSAAYVDDL
ncbi:MAG: ComF family protein [Myxococcales bacterium]|nr:ComF family protein [Myxococcales bacterium]